MIAWAGSVGPQTAALVEAILRERPHPEQGYRSCLGLMRLAKREGVVRMEAACRRALSGRARSYTSVHAILKAGLDRVPVEAEADAVPRVGHAHVRGPSYYDS